MSNWRWILAPLSGLYGLGLRVRHAMYDARMLSVYSPSLPTICVGNLAVGGTGKTPHVEYLVRLLSSQYRVAVLSRGYGRRTRGFVLADEQSTAAQIGDEPMQIHTHFPSVPLAVCENRVRGIRQLQRLVPDLEVVVLDDALQHRRIRCGMNILLTEYNHLYVFDHLLPYGRLRDLKTRASKADIIITTKCPDTLQPIDRRVVEMQLKPAAFQGLYFSHICYQYVPEAGKVLLLTGIARPESLLDYVQSFCPVVKHMSFADHHAYTEQDVQQIWAVAQDFDYVLTTEKDLARLQQTTLPQLLGNRLRVMPIAVSIDKDFDQRVLRYVAEGLHKNKK